MCVCVCAVMGKITYENDFKSKSNYCAKLFHFTNQNH